MKGTVTANRSLGIIEVISDGGDVTIDDLIEQKRAVELAAQDFGLRKVFVDASAENSLPSTVTILDFFANLPGTRVYAMYSRETQSSHDKMQFAETVGVNRNVAIRHFTDKTEALAWLREQPFPNQPPVKS